MSAILTILTKNEIHFIADTAKSVVDENDKPKRIEGTYTKVGMGSAFSQLIYALGGDVPWGDKIKEMFKNTTFEYIGNEELESIATYCRTSDESTDEYINLLLLGTLINDKPYVIAFSKSDGYTPEVIPAEDNSLMWVLGYNSQPMKDTALGIWYKNMYTREGKISLTELAQETFKTGNCECIGGDYLENATLKINKTKSSWDGRDMYSGRTSISHIQMEGIYADKFKI